MPSHATAMPAAPNNTAQTSAASLWDAVGGRASTNSQVVRVLYAARWLRQWTPTLTGATIRPLRRDRLGGLIHEYVPVA